MDVILIAGMPASGKTTLASKISREFGYPILEKDIIKEALFDTLGFSSYAEKRHLDVVANEVLLRCLEKILGEGVSVIVVNNFRSDMQPRVQEVLDRFDCNSVLVFLDGDCDEFYRRYVERDQHHLRHLGHVLQEHYPPLEGDSLEHDMTREEFSEKFEKLGMSDFQICGPRLDLITDGTQNLDFPKLISQIREALLESSR